MDAIRKEQAKLMTAAASASKGQSKNNPTKKHQAPAKPDNASSHYSILFAGDTNIDNQAEQGPSAALSGVELLLLNGTVPANFVEYG